MMRVSTPEQYRQSDHEECVRPQVGYKGEEGIKC